MEQTMAGDPKQAETLGTRDRRHGLVPDDDVEAEEELSCSPTSPALDSAGILSEPYAGAVNMNTVFVTFVCALTSIQHSCHADVNTNAIAVLF